MGSNPKQSTQQYGPVTQLIGYLIPEESAKDIGMCGALKGGLLGDRTRGIVPIKSNALSFAKGKPASSSEMLQTQTWREQRRSMVASSQCSIHDPYRSRACGSLLANKRGHCDASISE
jgi:hypothetical protein